MPLWLQMMERRVAEAMIFDLRWLVGDIISALSCRWDPRWMSSPIVVLLVCWVSSEPSANQLVESNQHQVLGHLFFFSPIINHDQPIWNLYSTGNSFHFSMPLPFSRGHQNPSLAHVNPSVSEPEPWWVSPGLAAAWATVEDGVLPVLLRMRPVQEIGRGLTPIPVGYRWW